MIPKNLDEQCIYREAQFYCIPLPETPKPSLALLKVTGNRSGELKVRGPVDQDILSQFPPSSVFFLRNRWFLRNVDDFLLLQLLINKGWDMKSVVHDKSQTIYYFIKTTFKEQPVEEHVLSDSEEEPPPTTTAVGAAITISSSGTSAKS